MVGFYLLPESLEQIPVKMSILLCQLSCNISVCFLVAQPGFFSRILLCMLVCQFLPGLTMQVMSFCLISFSAEKLASRSSWDVYWELAKYVVSLCSTCGVHSLSSDTCHIWIATAERFAFHKPDCLHSAQKTAQLHLYWMAIWSAFLAWNSIVTFMCL